MGTVPEAYYQFVMDHVPYVYVIPPNTPDPSYGRGVLAASFALDFLYEAYSAPQFEDRKASIYAKIVSLANWVLTQQCTDPARKAYGGFKSNETSTYYYSIDACRALPSLLRAYELTNDARYLNAAKLAGGTFLKTMQVVSKKTRPFGEATPEAGAYVRTSRILLITLLTTNFISVSSLLTKNGN